MDYLTRAIAHLEAGVEYDNQSSLSETDVKCIRSHLRMALGALLNKVKFDGSATPEQVAEVKADVRARHETSE